MREQPIEHMQGQTMEHMQGQTMEHMQGQNKSPDLIKLGLLFAAFGIVSYAWLRTSRAIVHEIEK